MAHMDVPKFIRRLRAGGISEDVAMTHAEAVTELINDGFATRADLHSFTNDLLSEINHVRDTLRSEIAGLRIEMNALEDRLTSKIEGVRNEMKALEDRLTAKFEKEILSLENRLLLKFGGMLATGIGLLAVFQALVK